MSLPSINERQAMLINSGLAAMLRRRFRWRPHAWWDAVCSLGGAIACPALNEPKPQRVQAQAARTLLKWRTAGQEVGATGVRRPESPGGLANLHTHSAIAVAQPRHRSTDCASELPTPHLSLRDFAVQGDGLSLLSSSNWIDNR